MLTRRPRPLRRTRRPARLAALLVTALGLAPLAPAAAAGLPGPTGTSGGCATPLLPGPTPAGRAAALLSPADRQVAAARNHTPPGAWTRQARTEDHLWLDACGHRFYVEPATPVPAAVARQAAAVPSSTATDTAPLSETFNLQSLPGAAKTIYLDFRGATITGTAWNASYGATLTAAPYSITAPADTNFTDRELTEIQHAWQVVAEDYAPFDVNVTTRDPGTDAIDRTGPGDTQYGSHVLITGGGPIFDDCGCGGLAYVDVFALAGASHAYYQPAWVFTNGTSPASGKYFGEAISHEAGHNLGLSHDGTGTAGYYEGASPWAPIMGVAYTQPISQWSAGQYPGANNTENDLAILGAHVSVRADDYGDTAAVATGVDLGGTADGLITTPADVDAFRFTAAGPTTVTVTPTASLPDLDVALSILDADGRLVDTVNPPAAATSYTTATGLGATWQVNAPDSGATYTALVDGAGNGDPATAGRYSDYGSLGRYRISVAAGTAPLAVTTDPAAPLTATAGTAYQATPFVATGGTAPYTWSATGVPTGLALAAETGTLTGTPTRAGSWQLVGTVTDATGATATTTTTLNVAAAPVRVPATTLTLTRGQEFTGYLTATGGDGSYTFTADAAPAWATVWPDGTVTGTPPETGSYTFTVTARSGGGQGSGPVTLEVTDAPVTTPTVLVPTQTLRGTVGTPLLAHLAATGGTGAYAWTIPNPPADLPVLVTRDGTVSGTPTRAGTWEFTARAASGTAAATGTIRLVVAGDPVTVTPTTLHGRAGVPLLARLSATGGSGLYAWSATGLPAGLALTGSGTLTGTPTRAGTFTFPVTATSDGATGRATITLRVEPGARLADQAVKVRAGQAFRIRLAGGGDGTTWRAVSGLPAGVHLTPAGVLEGTVARAGTYVVKVSATSAGASATGRVTLLVLARRTQR